jgi:hypothetical protein
LRAIFFDVGQTTPHLVAKPRFAGRLPGTK